MFDNNFTVNSRKETLNNNPLNNDLIWAIEYGEPSLDEILSYCKDLETFLGDETNIAKTGYYESIRHHEIVTEYLEARQQEETRETQSKGKSDFFSRRPSISAEDLNKELDLLIEHENPTSERIIHTLDHISKKSGIHPFELRKAYEARKIKVERKELRRETQRELNHLIKLEEAKLDLSDYLSDKLANYIKDYCEGLNIKQESCLLAILTTLSSCHHMNARILLSRKYNYYQPGTLYSMFVAEPGSMKSLVRAMFTTLPLGKLQIEYQKQYDKQVAELKQLEMEYRNTPKEERSALFPEGLPDIPDRPNRAYLTSPTVEAFIHQFKAYKEKRIFLSCDEIKRLFDSMNQYKGGSGGDEGAYLEMYDGGSIVIARAKAENNLKADETALSIFGTTQLSKLKELWGNGMDEDGMFSRFLYVVQTISNPRLPYEDSDFDCPIVPELEDLYGYCNQFSAHTYTLSNSAYKRYIGFYNFLTDEARRASIPFMQHAYSKAKGHCGRLAMNLHVLDFYGNIAKRNFSTEVQEETIVKAIALTKFFLGQAEFLYKNLCDEENLSPILKDILALSKRMGWIAANVVKSNRRRLRKTDVNEIREWFLELETLGYGQTEGKGARLKFRVT